MKHHTQKTAEHTLFSSFHGSFTKIDYMWDHRVSLKKLLMTNLKKLPMITENVV